MAPPDGPVSRAVLIVSVFMLFLHPPSGAQPSSGEPSFVNVFENDPFPRTYWLWWRPYKVILDQHKCSAIQKQVTGIEDDKLDTVDLDAAFGENQTSAFLFPVLATQGEKGIKLLNRFLAKYVGAGELDDRWLLIVASLGRVPAVEARTSLEKELERISREYNFSAPKNVYGIAVPQEDARVAVVDALVAWEARQYTLSAAKIEDLCRRVPRLSWKTWMIGLEWSRQLLPESNLVSIIEDGLALRDKQDLRKGTDGEMVSDQLRALREFMIVSKDIWPVTKKVLLSQKERSAVLSQYLIVLYSQVLVAKADEGNGQYPIDEAEVRVFTTSGMGKCRALDQACKVLMSCAPSQRYTDWEEFLAKHAGWVRGEDETFVRHSVQRIHGPKTAATTKVYERLSPFDSLATPGVYMNGFRGLRRRR